MHPHDWRLINGNYLEAIPAALARSRGNATARALSHADWLIRRKEDGRFLAVRQGDTVTELQRNAFSPVQRNDLLTLSSADTVGETPRPLTGLIERLQTLGVSAVDYGNQTGLSVVAEPSVLSYAGRDRYARPLWLTHATALRWQQMRQSALHDGITLEAISGYRSHAYQWGIFQRKRARGQTIEQILSVNAAPGYSEHHSGRALDIGTPGEAAAEESFELTPAFAWLTQHASVFGFTLSYPRNNQFGIIYEPWHWFFSG